MLVAIGSQSSFVLVFVGHRTIIARYVAKWGTVLHTCVCVKPSTKRAGIAPFWGSSNLPEKVLRDMGYRSDSIAISRDIMMGPSNQDKTLVRKLRLSLLVELVNTKWCGSHCR